jgi:parallel beta-helix repeat protein
VYVSGTVECTLTEIKTLGNASIPLTLVDADDKVWFLGANLVLQNGATLALRGEAVGGDVNELRLKSNNVSNGFVTILVEWGSVLMDHTHVTSWNESAGGPDAEYQQYGRAYIRVRSWLDGATPRESRMDIKHSEVEYLGYNTSEGYGLTWKVLGSAFDTVGVFGDVVSSTIHHNYFGVYTYGGQNMTFRDNEVFENVKYGIDPHDDSDFLIIERNYVHHNGNHGIICSQRCNNLLIAHNTSSNNVGNGIMLHRSTNDSIVEHNTLYDNSDSGIALFESHRNIVRHNEARGNEKGIRLSVGSSDNLVEDNVFSESGQYGVYFYKGSDTPISGDGKLRRNIFRGNSIETNSSVGMKIQDAEDNIFDDNELTGNGSYAVELRKSTHNTFRENTLVGNVRNYYYAASQAKDEIRDSEAFGVKIGETTSTMTIIDSENAVLENTKGLPTTVMPSSSTIVLTRTNAGSSIVQFTRRPLLVIPSSGIISVRPLLWNLSGDFSKRWTAVSSSSDPLVVAHSVGDLAPSTSYDILVDGELFGSFVANMDGIITFSYTGTFQPIKTFEIEPSL